MASRIDPKLLVIMLSVIAAVVVLGGMAGEAYASLNYTLPAPSATTVDGGYVVLNTSIRVANASSVIPPAAFISWDIILDLDFFNATGVTGEAYYVDLDTGATYTVPLDITYNSYGDPRVVSLEARVDSTASNNIVLYIVARIPALPAVYTVTGATIQHSLAYQSGGSIDTGITSSTTVYITPYPVSVRVSVEPLFASPGAPLSILLNASDYSGVYNASIVVRDENGSIVASWFFGPSDTGNTTSFSRILSLNTTGLSEGKYSVEASACDLLAAVHGTSTCSTAETEFRITRVFYVPGNFTSLSEALGYRGVADGAVIVVSGVVNESSTLVVSKRVSIIGEKSARIVFVQPASYGFNITAPGVEIQNLSIEGARIGFLVSSNNSLIQGVDVKAAKFLELLRPDKTLMRNNITGSSLNSTPVLYLVGEEAKSIEHGNYSDVYLYTGNYSMAGVSAWYTELGYASLQAINSSLGELKAIADSSLLLRDSSYTAYHGTPGSSILLEYSVLVTVEAYGQPIAGASITLSGALLDEPLVLATGSTGSVEAWVPVERGGEAITERNSTLVVEASFKGLSNTTVLNLTTATKLVLALPAPTISPMLVSITGEKISKLVPGQLAVLEAPYNLMGFNDTVNVKILLLRSGEEVSSVEFNITTQQGEVKAVVMVPWSPGVYRIKLVFSPIGLAAREFLLP